MINQVLSKHGIAWNYRFGPFNIFYRKNLKDFFLILFEFSFLNIVCVYAHTQTHTLTLQLSWDNDSPLRTLSL